MSEEAGKVAEDDIGEVWTLTKDTDEIERERELKRAEFDLIRAELKRCPVCGRPAKMVTFGLEGNGVWVGCDRNMECVKYVEIHTEGWSAKECADEWNRYNGGMFGVLRRCKIWWNRRFGKERWEKRAEEKRKAEEMREKEAKRREVFGISGENGSRKWYQFWRNGKK